MPKFLQRDRSQPCLLPPDMRDWLPEDDLAHFVVEAVERVPMDSFQVNERGTGSAQCHPRTMLALPVHCHANGIFGSRRIERATPRDIGVRCVAANCHPDHDTICTFRRNSFEAVSAAFPEVLPLAKEPKLLRVGTASVDGTKVDANANRRNGIRHDRAGELRERLRVEIKGLLDRAERDAADAASEPQGLPEELKRRETPKAKLDKACAELERRAKARADSERADSERAEHERKVEAREQREGRSKGKRIKAPAEEPRDEERINLTDADSSPMRRSRRHEHRQACNAQAAVDADGSRLAPGSRVSVSASDRNELVADVDSMPGALGSPDRVLADGGCATGSEVSELEGRGVEVLVATGAGGGRRRHDFRPEPPPKPAKEPRAEWIKAMRERMELPENRAHCRLRRHAVEPAFGIVKQAMGFRQFPLRGVEKVEGEWKLVTLACSCRRLHRLMLA